MSCGSAQVLADLMCGKTPAIRADDLSVFRYAGARDVSPDAELARA